MPIGAKCLHCNKIISLEPNVRSKCPACGGYIIANRQWSPKMPPKTHVSNFIPITPKQLAREGKLISEVTTKPSASLVAHDWHRQGASHIGWGFKPSERFQPIVIDNRAQLRSSRRYLGMVDILKVISDRIAMLKKDIEELNQFKEEEMKVDKLIRKIKRQIKDCESLI